jgi:hypothetical protein
MKNAAKVRLLLANPSFPRYGASPPFGDPPECGSFHTAARWTPHWADTGLVEVESCSCRKDGGKHRIRWEEARAAGGRGHSGFPSDAPALRADRGRFPGLVQMAARTPGVSPVEVAVPPGIAT